MPHGNIANLWCISLGHTAVSQGRAAQTLVMNTCACMLPECSKEEQFCMRSFRSRTGASALLQTQVIPAAMLNDGRLLCRFAEVEGMGPARFYVAAPLTNSAGKQIGAL